MSLMQIRQADNDNAYIVEGYAATFEPYLLYSDGDMTINERIDKRAFEGSDMSDVLFLYDHSGRVLARQKNGTLTLSVDDRGLKVVADLGSTSESRAMYEDIKSGLIDQMSFAFSVADEHYERETHTRVIDRMQKIYDVSAVSMPANPTTSISSRSAIDGAIEVERAERHEAEERERLEKEIEILLMLGGVHL